jgi:hypothetical protein
VPGKGKEQDRWVPAAIVTGGSLPAEWRLPPFPFDIVVERLVCRAQFLISRATTTCVVRLPKLFNASLAGLKYPMDNASDYESEDCRYS